MRTGIYPGSFDPLTNGHLDVIRRAAHLFDKLIVAVAHNSEKTTLFTKEERVQLIQASIDLENVHVTHFDGLIANFAADHNATALVRGLRAISDFEFEFQMALMNRRLQPGIETVFLTPQEEATFISSRTVKEVALHHGDISSLVPPPVESALKKAFNS